MRKRTIALIISAAIILTGCGAVQGEISEEQTTVAELPATTEKAPEIEPETATETQETTERQQATTEAETEKSQNDDLTAKIAENPQKLTTNGEKTTMPGKILFVSERKTADRIAVTTEETTGEINADGYGWVCLQYSAPYNIMDGHLTRKNGSIRCFGHRETWYSTNEGAGQATAKEIPGKHVAEDGTIRDEDGYICVASSDLAFYSIVMTSVGPGKVYDCGCSSGTIDVYTDW